MQDYRPQVSHSVHLLLLLLSSMPHVAVQSFLYPQSVQKPYHEDPDMFHTDGEWESRQTGEGMEDDEEDVLQYCDGDFDVYFIFDKSRAVQEWADLYTAWEDMVEKYLNPKLRMSFILFDYQATVRLELTSDRRKIRYELSRVSTLRLDGSTVLQKGLEKANEQIQRANSGAATRMSLIITVIWGQLSPQVLRESKKEADKARSMGAYVYCVGIDSYDRKMLSEIADSEDMIFIVEDSPKMFHEAVDLIGTLTCLELRYVEPSPLCTGENHPVILRGYGFHYAQNLSQIICRFKLSDSKVIDKNATDKNFTVIICPRPEIKQSRQTVLVEVSLNNGRDFLAHTIPVNTSDCRPPPVTTTVVPETSTLPPMATPKTSLKTTGTTIPRTTPVPTTSSPPSPPSPPLPAPPPPTSPGARPLTTIPPPAEPSQQVLLSTMVLVLMLIPVLLWWFWWLCCRKAPKALPARAPQPKPRKKKQPPPPVSPPAPAPPANAPPIVIVCCCTCCNVYVSRGTEGNVTMCTFNPLSCHQLPLMWSQSSDQ
ncbi:hypothetical protein STEG23_023673, partial [Scotinomys teguina]